MRQTAARLNRTWLTILGLVLLVAGLVVVLIGTGLLVRAADAVGLTLTGPASQDRVLGADVVSAFATPWVQVLLAVIGAAVALLALAWLVAQIPRRNPAKPFRLHDSPADGLTRCDPNVLTDAVEEQVKALPDVQDASAVLRGTVQEPDLTLRIIAGERADLPQLLRRIESQIVGDLQESLDTRLRRLGVEIDIGTVRTSKSSISVTPAG
jgi:hypothetical protein